MITRKQYLKALATVEAYRKQIRDTDIIGCFSIDDLEELRGTIQIPKLKEGLVDNTNL